MGDYKLSTHFSFYELTDSNTFSNLVSENRSSALEFEHNLVLTAKALESQREILGSPLKISSGYRCSRLNNAIGGSTTSSHTRGQAADYKPIDVSPSDAFKKLKLNRSKLAFTKKIIFESIGNTWIHTESSEDKNCQTEFYTTTDGKSYTRVKL